MLLFDNQYFFVQQITQLPDYYAVILNITMILSNLRSLKPI